MQIPNFDISDSISSQLHLPTILQAEGHAEGISLSASTSVSPNVDGVIGTDEWVDADYMDFVLASGDAARERGVGDINATIYVMNDHRNLYITLRIGDNGGLLKTVTIFFDDNHDGVMELGEDVLRTGTDSLGEEDWHILFITENSFMYQRDHPANGGSQQGSFETTGDGMFNYYEFSHPLCSLDTEHDFCLSEGDTVGFNLRYNQKPWGYVWPAGSTVPANDTSAWGDITIAHSSAPEEVGIDIQPRNSDNTVDCDSLKGKVKVGILTDGGFDAQTVDVSTIDLEGVDASKINFKDLDHDGDTDALVKFKKSSICELTNNLSTESISFRLYGQTADGGQFVGTDSIRIK